MNEEKDPVGLIEDGVSYEGLVLIPGFMGGTILSEQLLLIYGTEFAEGTAVLWILILAVLLKGYQSQFLTALNGLDRPDISFWIYAIFIVSNLVLNVGLISLYSWVGAAVATALSAVIGLSLSYAAVRRLTDFTIPVRIISKQWAAAVTMGVFVYTGLWVEQTFSVIDHNFGVVLVLVSLGALIYFVLLLALSAEFRNTVDRNLPVTIPYLS